MSTADQPTDSHHDERRQGARSVPRRHARRRVGRRGAQAAQAVAHRVRHRAASCSAIGVVLASTCWSRPASASGATPTPSCWAWDITNFVCWIGIGHAGTLITAVLFLFRQNWRTSINRFAEAMTIFAVMCAGLFPLLHIGRPWFAYWMIPHPEPDGHVAAVPEPARCGTCSRSARTSRRRSCSGTWAWSPTSRRSATAARRSGEKLRAIDLRHLSPRLARLGPPVAPLRARVPDPRRVSRRRWCSRCTRSCRSTSRPRSCPAGTPRSSRRTSSPAPSSRGFAMVLTLMIPARQLFGLKHIIKIEHIEVMNKIMLATGMMVGLRVRDGVLHRLVLRQPVRAVHVHQPRVRPVLVGVLRR